MNYLYILGIGLVGYVVYFLFKQVQTHIYENMDETSNNNGIWIDATEAITSHSKFNQVIGVKTKLPYKDHKKWPKFDFQILEKIYEDISNKCHVQIIYFSNINSYWVKPQGDHPYFVLKNGFSSSSHPIYRSEFSYEGGKQSILLNITQDEISNLLPQLPFGKYGKLFTTHQPVIKISTDISMSLENEEKVLCEWPLIHKNFHNGMHSSDYETTTKEWEHFHANILKLGFEEDTSNYGSLYKKNGVEITETPEA